MEFYTPATTQDEQRTGRLFLSAIGSAMGINDQSYAGQDGYVVNYPRQYQAIGINGAIGVEGAPISNAQGGLRNMSPLVLLAGAFVVYLALKHG
jgi:hypothetical protein